MSDASIPLSVQLIAQGIDTMKQLAISAVLFLLEGLMLGVISALIREDGKRAGGVKIPFRPDHGSGHRMLSDVNKIITPGYAGIGRLKGLGELRGVMRAVERLS